MRVISYTGPIASSFYTSFRKVFPEREAPRECLGENKSAMEVRNFTRHRMSGF